MIITPGPGSGGGGGDATEATLATRLSESDFDTKTGALTETAPATDTASSGLNGRLQRIAQRLTSLIALLPSTLVGGRLDTNLGAWLGSTAPTVGQKAMASSVPVVLASDQTAVPVSGTVTATGPLTDAQLRATPVPISGSVTALDEDSATSASSNVTGTGANVAVLASNAARKGATIFNDSGVAANVKLGATASATSFTVKMVDQAYYEVPYKYTGIIDGFWASGSLRVTELT